MSDCSDGETRGKGRPSAYKPEFVEQARKLCELGATDAEIANFFEVDTRTIYRWKNEHPDFCQALVIGKEICDERVVRSLYNRAVGFDYTEQEAIKTKKSQHEETVEVVDVVKHSPPDTAAARYWLNNRKRGEWADRQTNEHGGIDGAPIATEVTHKFVKAHTEEL